MTETQSGASSPLVSDSYYHDGARWERDIYRRLEASRNAWRAVSVILGLVALASIVVLGMLVPLKSTEVVTLLVDKATGFVEVARPLEQGGPISEREAVTQANIVRFIRARETYDPPALRDNFELASLLSAGAASKDLSAEFDAGNPQNPMKLYGVKGRVSVFVKSVSFLTDGWMKNSRTPGTASVRFQTTLKTDRENIVQNWVANVRFRYTRTPMKNEWRFDNPLGFQVIEYRRDQESLAPAETAGGPQ